MNIMMIGALGLMAASSAWATEWVDGPPPSSFFSARVYSLAPDSAGSKLISPPTGSTFDRIHFQVHEQPSLDFSVQINHRLPSGDIARLGFGAPAVPAGLGQEACPDAEVAIPRGAHWAKLWLFRADLSRWLAGNGYDYLFVVTPTSVMFSQMADSSSAISQVYTPRRYLSAGHCASSDPENPMIVGDCGASSRIGPYGLKIHDVVTRGDAPESDPSRPAVYPVCVIQRD